jgi:5'-nucleotidase
MSNRPLILITNDDGVHAPGIKHLWQSLREIGDLVVVAPTYEQSAVGLSITVRDPLHITPVHWNDSSESSIWSVNGTPADCIKLALNVILKKSPDLVVSGINRGTNAGRNLLYSGTVGGVIEGLMHDIPGIAFSICDYFDPNYQLLEQHIPSIVNYMLNHPLPAGTFLNVNFPQQMQTNFQGVRLVKQGKEYWGEDPEHREHPAEKSSYYWLGSRLAQFDEDLDSDIVHLRQGFATAVPIHVGDLTHHRHLEQHRQAFETFVNQSTEAVKN